MSGPETEGEMKHRKLPTGIYNDPFTNETVLVVEDHEY
jgi:hypothetical protein